MKTLSLISIVLVAVTTSFAQESDQYMATHLVGSWEHVSSTYPGGDVVSFRKEFNLFNDGTGICYQFSGADTLSANFAWEVEDSTIVLYILDKKGEKIEADTQFISLLAPMKMYLSEISDGIETGKVCVYRRMDNQIAQY